MALRTSKLFIRGVRDFNQVTQLMNLVKGFNNKTLDVNMM